MQYYHFSFDGEIDGGILARHDHIAVFQLHVRGVVPRLAVDLWREVVGDRFRASSLIR